MLKYLIPIIFLLISCEAEKAPEILEKSAEWRKLLRTSIPQGTMKSDAEAWFKGKEILVTCDPSHLKCYGTVEVVKGDGVVCKEWYIIAEYQVNKHGQVEDITAHPNGLCL